MYNVASTTTAAVAVVPLALIESATEVTRYIDSRRLFWASNSSEMITPRS
jgi:hypothetical protein